MSASHLSTQQWQSFETRMRQRRGERCVLRAEAAIQSGDEAAALEALAEAKQLDCAAPEFDALRASVVEKRTAAAAAAAAQAAALQRAARRQRTRTAITVAAVGIAAFGGSAALVYKASSGRPVVSAPLTLSQPITSSSTSRIPATPAQAAPSPTAVADHEKAFSPAAGTRRAVESRVVLQPPPRPREPLRAARNTTALLGDVRLQTTDAAADAYQLSTPPVGASPFSAAPGDVAAVPAPPVPLADEVRPGDEKMIAAAPALLPPDRVPAVDESARVRSVLSKYEAAYSGLDANAAQSIWPSVDGRSLTRAFQSLESQRVSLGRCALAIDGATAHADCDGSTTWTPKIGGGSRTESRRYKFELQNSGGTWQILTASAR